MPHKNHTFARFLSLAILLCSATSAFAEGLTPVHLRVGGREVKLKTPALSDGKETYAPLDVLKAVGATGRLNTRQDAVTVITERGVKRGEIALARPDGKPMLLLSDLARLLNARIEQPDATSKDGKPIAGKRGETVYLLAKVVEARYESGSLRVFTSFPVPYKTRTLKVEHLAKGYVDCLGATIKDGLKLTPVDANEKRVLRLRAGQNSLEMARVVIELSAGVTLISSDSPSNASTRILAGVEGVPKRIARNDTQSPANPDNKIAVHDQGERNPTDVDSVPTDKGDGETALPLPTNTAPKPKRGAVSARGNAARVVPPITIMGLQLKTPNAQQVRLEVATTGRVSPYVHYQQNATQLAIDIPNALLKLTDPDSGEQSLDHPLVSGLHIEQLPQDPPVTRITLDMNRVVGFSVDPQSGKFALDLHIPRNATGALADKLIVVDAGHGGSSSGAVGRGGDGTHYEKDVTLGIALRLRTVLEGCGARVVMTRDKDVDVALYDRPHLANDIRADLFISVHNDSNSRPNSASGTSTYYHMSDPSSRALATCVQQAVSAITGLPSRGALSDGILYQNGLAVLRVSAMPAVLCEVGYINNSRDRSKLLSADFQQRVAVAMARGLRCYIEGGLLKEKAVPPKANEPETETPSVVKTMPKDADGE